MSAHLADDQIVHRALELAVLGVGLASPNPHVGAVIADAHGNIVAEGTYTYAGRKHAEILALEAAGNRARGGTLYINLEPHAHQGRTPPCTDALIAAGIQRVVASMPDPNPRVSGRGFDQLRAAGVRVEVGIGEAEARRLNEPFARYIRRGVPLVTLKAAMTLDGKIAPAQNETAPRTGASPAKREFSGTWITGEATRAHVHALRHEHDAILAGVGTVLADNPLLTDRSGLPRRRPLLRVILDSHLRLPLESRMLESPPREQRDDLLILCSSAHEAKKKSELERLGVRVETMPNSASDSGLDFSAILRRLGELEITSVLIEGGAGVYAAALAAGAVDKLFLYYAPKIFGADALSFSSGMASRNFSRPIQIKNLRLHSFGDDLGVEGYLRDPYDD